MSRHPWILFTAGMVLIGAISCDRPSATAPSKTSDLADDNTPTFFLAWSDYPSWSIFGAADALGYINGAAGRVGPIEKRLRVDIALQRASYDSCLSLFQSGVCDATCMTNVDALIASGSRDTVAVLPTSSRNHLVLEMLGESPDRHSWIQEGDSPGEIIDMVVIGQDTLQRPGADRFIKALMAVFYQVSEELHGEETERVLAALSGDASMNGEDPMREAVQQTAFYETPEAARDLMDSDAFRDNMQTVEQLCVEKDLVADPTVEYGPVANGGQLRFDSSFLGTGD